MQYLRVHLFGGAGSSSASRSRSLHIHYFFDDLHDTLSCHKSYRLPTQRISSFLFIFALQTSLFSHISNVGLTALIPLVILLEGKQLLTTLQDRTFDIQTLLTLLLVNGLTYTLYNLTSFLVLSRVELVAHAVLNVFRRVFIIVFTSLYFGMPLSFLNTVGVLMAVAGVLLFGYSRSLENRVPLSPRSVS